MDDPVVLHVSDDPEGFGARGQLFQAPVRPGAVSRMFLDHVNECAQPMRVIACLANAGFPGRAMLGDRRVRGAAIFDVEPSASARLEFRVMACDPVNQSPDVFDQLPVSQSDGVGRRGVFDIAGASDGSESWSGSPIAFKFGEDTHARDASDPYQGPPHASEFAITKRFACTLNDAIGTGASTALYASPRGGKATATFIIGGEIIEARGAQAGQRYKVSPVDVPAGGEITVSVVTMAEINSYYPFELSISADDAQIPDPFSGDSPLYRR